MTADADQIYQASAERAVPSNYLRAIDRLDCPTLENLPEDIAVRQGQEALRRLRDHSTWEDWKRVGRAHEAGRTTAMRDAHVNKPAGRVYNAAFHAWLEKFGFDLDKGDRKRLFDVMDHLIEIETWLATLKPDERLRLNHPSSVWRRWKKATAPATADPDKAPKVSAVQKLKEENARMKREIAHGGGDLWTLDDRPEDIARVMADKLKPDKIEQVANEMMELAKQKRTLLAKVAKQKRATP
jgi:hypothetical protein